MPSVQGGESPHLVANAAFLAEKGAKEAAEGKLTTLRRSVAHKDELLKTLKAKVLAIPHKSKGHLGKHACVSALDHLFVGLSKSA